MVNIHESVIDAIAASVEPYSPHVDSYAEVARLRGKALAVGVDVNNAAVYMRRATRMEQRLAAKLGL